MAITYTVNIRADGIKVDLPAEAMAVLQSAADGSGISLQDLLDARVEAVLTELENVVYANVREAIGKRYLLIPDQATRDSVLALLPALPAAEDPFAT